MQSLAIGMFGQIMEEFHKAHRLEAGRISTELVELLEAVGDPTLTVALIASPITAKHEAGGVIEALGWAERAIDLAGGDATKGKLTMGSPLALDIAMRGVLRSCLGIAGWRADLRRAADMATSAELITRTAAVYYAYVVPMLNGALLPDDFVIRESAEVLAVAELVAENVTLGVARFSRGFALVARGGPESQQGIELVALVREAAMHRQYSMVAVPLVDGVMAREATRLGDFDRAVELARSAFDELTTNGGTIWIPLASTTLVEALLQRGAKHDLEEAQAAADRLAALPTDPGLVLKEIWLLRSRALLAQAQDDDAVYRLHRDRYREMATNLGFEGHIAMAEAMV